jgi:GNAT superfamily N-acetyltransferase
MRPATTLEIRAITEEDVGSLFGLISELASYERRRVEGDVSALRHSLFEEGAASALLIEIDEKQAGYAIFFRGFSSFSCGPILWLEDLYVRPEHRGRGIGRQVMAHLARRAMEDDLDRIEWHVLDWNRSALGFYEKLGGVTLDDWRTVRLERDGIRRLAEGNGRASADD